MSLSFASLADQLHLGAVCPAANIACGKGQQPHSSGTRCVVCPRNSYKDTQGNMPCTRCPNGTFTAGRRAQSHDSITKCLAGGLTSSATGVKAPRLQHFRRHLSAAQSYMHSTLETRQPLPCSQGCSTAAIKRLTKPVAYIAASPQVVSPRHRLLRMPAERPHVQNQGLCATCVNAAISSAAEAAAAVEAGTNTSGIAFSPVYAYYCEPTMLRSCASGWTLKDALDGLASATVRYLPHATCTHNVDLERIRTVAPSQLPAACDAVYNKCLSLRLVSECTYTALTDFWEIQRAIRLSGAAITRVSVGADFVEYFQSNPRGIYNLTSITNSSGTVPHAVILTGYNNTGQYWWAQNSYGTAFANQGVFKIAYGTALVGNPNETYALSCSLNPLYPTNPLKRWPLQVLPHTSLQPMPCYSYTTRAGDYLAGIADHFGIDLLQMVAENAYVLSTTLANRPDLSTSIAGKRLLLCGITKDLYKTAHLDCGAGEYQSSVTGRCQVCPHDTYKTRKGPTPCRACLPGTVTNGCNAADHDSPNDCTPGMLLAYKNGLIIY
ncbi:hypothetical protein COO60DRAFT_329142 [Scenedesmus sp. NREL 46B-D3]|nr:hypothetical protein COO60DRAFT_329142 [Scenedesmus sp. NREL 46B-D3]